MIYVAMASRGQYEDKYSWVDGCFSTHEAAIGHATAKIEATRDAHGRFPLDGDFYLTYDIFQRIVDQPAGEREEEARWRLWPNDVDQRIIAEDFWEAEP